MRHPSFGHLARFFGLELFVLLGLPSLTFWSLGLTFSTSASGPVGLYQYTADVPNRGTLVALCLPENIAQFAKARGYIGVGFVCPGWTQPLLKTVYGLPGDRVSITRAGVEINGTLIPHTAPLVQDSNGRTLTPAVGEFVVAEHELVVLSTYSPKSFDSRYFAALPLTAIRSGMRPFLTFGEYAYE